MEGMPGPAVSMRPSRRRCPLRQFLRKYQTPSLASSCACASVSPTWADMRMPIRKGSKRLPCSSSTLANCACDFAVSLPWLRGEEIAISALGDVDQGLGRTRARDPDRGMRLLRRPRPRIDAAQWIVPAFPREWSVFGPAAVDEIDGLPELLP